MNFFKKNIWILIVGLLVTHLLFLLKLKFTAWPEMIFWPYLITQGWLPYKDIAIAHTPLLILDLSLVFKIFGIGILQLKIYTWLLIVLTDLVVYWCGIKIWNKRIATTALVFFIFLQIFYEGNGLWFDLALTPLAALLFFLVQKKRYFATGLLWALMFLVKQTAFWFLFPIILSLNFKKGFLKSTKQIILGIVLTFGVFIFLLNSFGILFDFYNWAINFGIFVLPNSYGQVQMPHLKTLLISLFSFFIFIPLVFNGKMSHKKLLLWALAGSMGAYPRFEYFHFQPALPFIAFALGVVFSEAKKFTKYMKVVIVLYIFGGIYLFANFFMRNYQEGNRFYEEDVKAVTQYIKENATEGEPLLVLNWWDSIYALTDTLPATRPWVPQLPWYVMLPGLEDQMLSSIVSANPKMIILKPYTETGLSSYIPEKINLFVVNNYKVKEKINGIQILTRK